jgi:tetratricopeptide (TPR) repeat protein
MGHATKLEEHADLRSDPPVQARGPSAANLKGASGRKKLLLSGGLALVVVFAAYSNHFHNSFHFDDSHTIVDNIFIRDLHNVPRFFTDATTFTSLPANQTWRPIVSLSLAVDYRLAHGLNPVWFHASTFFWFLVQLALMFVLFRHLLDATGTRPANPFVALFATLWYALHPAIAETVNYIIQRADLYATLAVVASLVMYIYLPGLRKFGLYLLPVAVGSAAKAPVVVFCGILLLYIFLYEEDADWRRFWHAFGKTIPATVVCIGLAVLTIKMTSKTFAPSGLASSTYWMSQPFVLMRYVRSFFLPLWLTADSDLRPVFTLFDPRAIIGILFCVALLGVGFRCIKRREHRPIAFGIFWFFFASAPTSIFVLAEIENDHRMFFPFVGLVLSVTWAAALLIFRLIDEHPEKRGQVILSVQVTTAVLLLAYAAGTWQRNIVWHSEESLWRDVTIKSPENGRGLMNYGLTLMSKGDSRGALDYFQRAAVFTPNYSSLEINTGIALGVLNQNQQSEAHFRRAIALAPQDAQPYYYYGRWLQQEGRVTESIANLKSAIARNSPWMAPRDLLMLLYLQQGQGEALHDLAQDTLRIAPSDAGAQRYLASSRNVQPPLVVAEKLAASQPSPEHYLNLSLLYHQAGRYQDCIDAAQKAVKLKPDYAEAYNNIAAAYQSMHQWDAAIEAAQHAVRLKPDFALAKNNLAWSQQQKRNHAP